MRDNMNGPQGHYPKWIKSEKVKYYMVSLACGIIIKKNQNSERQRADWCFPGVGDRRIGESAQKVEIVVLIITFSQAKKVS